MYPSKSFSTGYNIGWTPACDISVTVAKTLGGQRETTQRQLNVEKKKMKDGPRLQIYT